MRAWCALIAVSVVGGLSYGGGQEARAGGARSFAGSVSVGRIEADFEMPGGFTSRGKPGEARRFSEKRDQRFVPSHYGDILQVTAHGEDAVLWFRDGAGVVRNVTLHGATQQLFHIETQASRILSLRR